MEGKQADATSAKQAAEDGIMSRVTDQKHEIEVRTVWRKLLDDAPGNLKIEQVGNHEVYLIEGLFSARECEVLLAAAEEHGFGTTNYAKSYRGNLRLTSTDQGLADAVWERLQPLVPASVRLDDTFWDACGLNECWRLAKYYPGDRFQGHCDAAFQRSRDEISMFTVNIYMNEGFEGGSTRFYFKDHASSDYAVAPKAGLCLLFRQPPGQCYYHDGERLASGLKYLFRSDIMYRMQK